MSIRARHTLLLMGALLVPGLAGAAAPYIVESTGIEEWQPLPIDESASVEEHVLISLGGATGTYADPTRGSAGVELPFAMRFFGESYDALGVGAGLITFGPRSETLCPPQAPAVRPACANADGRPSGPIPRIDFPNRLLAVWWVEGGACLEIKSQGWGVSPERVFVLEMDCSAGRQGRYQAQIWLREESSVVEVRYREPIDPNDATEIFGHVGLMSPVEGGAVEGYPGLPCSQPGFSCRWRDYPANTTLRYSVPADLAVEAVITPGTGIPGQPLELQATIRNVGDAPVLGSNLRFYLGSRRSMSSDAISLGELTQAFDLEVGASIQVEHSATLPSNLEAGPYYILAQADPFGVVPREQNLANNLLASDLLLVGVSAPVLVAESVETPALLTPGAGFPLRWVVRNVGTAAAQRIAYGIYLSDDEEITSFDRRISLAELSVDALDEASETIQITLPDDVLPGLYYLGLLLDPDDTLPDRFKEQPIAVSEAVQAVGAELRVATDTLPDAELGKPWCVGLLAAGGDGIYRWSVKDGSKLPPGLQLEELPQGASEAGLPFNTRLCGRPASLGTFDFELEVRSASKLATRRLELQVRETALPLTIASSELPLATYLQPYELGLRAAGGRAPYHWRLISAALPTGVAFRSDGMLLGHPSEDGRFPLRVQVVDALGHRAERALVLLVSVPDGLSCGSRSLPSQQVGEAYDHWLSAAGGQKPYRWRSVETRRLPVEIGEPSVSLGNSPPPGLSLATAGHVSGAPSQVGRYLWTVAVNDAASMAAEDYCFIQLDVPADRGLTISTRRFAPAIAGEPYAIQLAAVGGEGTLHWRLLEGGRLPVGLSFLPNGRIEGYPALDQLEGEPSLTLPILVEVRDARNRRGIAPLSITVIAEREAPSSSREAPENEGGCTAASSSSGLLPLLAAAAFAIRRHRHV